MCWWWLPAAEASEGGAQGAAWVERGVGWLVSGRGGDCLTGVLRGEAETDEGLYDLVAGPGLGGGCCPRSLEGPLVRLSVRQVGGADHAGQPCTVKERWQLRRLACSKTIL